ncbi:MAG: hypothetical protein E4H10_13250 [Bacteroidia bacterium]|jgi:hypothetical protein|nr:MAG: hypothetical protein E4H10_13250 [Bacteroidia bacterium]
MTEFEKYIKEQGIQLDSDRPNPGHEERFLQKLDRHFAQPPVRKIRVRHMLQVAASLAIILTSAVLLLRQSGGGEQAGKEIPAAMIEADFYYASQLDERYEQISEFNFENEEEKTVLLNELKDLESYQQQLMDDFEANPDDDRVINALIRHYQVKLEVMDQIIIQLNQVKSETSEKHEKKSI